MMYEPRLNAQLYRRNLAQFLIPQEDKQLLYYDPSLDEYWDPQKDAHLSAKEAVALMYKSQNKVTIRFDHKFPK